MVGIKVCNPTSNINMRGKDKVGPLRTNNRFPWANNLDQRSRWSVKNTFSLRVTAVPEVRGKVPYMVSFSNTFQILSLDSRSSIGHGFVLLHGA